MTAPGDPRARRADIEGLRGIAVLLVVGFHAGVPWLRGAFAAVDVFFVLSGFFIGATMARRIATDEGPDLAELYGRRLWRLLPAFAVVAVATLASALLLYAPIDRPDVARHLASASLFAGNIAFALEGVNYFHAGENPYLHTWTLGVEWQLALLVPALAAWFAARGRRNSADVPAQRVKAFEAVLVGLAVVALLSFAWSARPWATPSMWDYFGPLTRLWAFALGAAAAVLIGGGQSAIGATAQRVGAAQALGLAGILAPALVVRDPSSYSVLSAVGPVAGTLLLLSAGNAATTAPVGRALASPLLVALGRVSFAWYLWHWPLMVLGAVLVPTIGVWGRLAWGALGLVLAIATTRWIEEPARTRLVPKLAGERPLLAGALVCLSLAGIGATTMVAARRHVAATVNARYAAAREDRVRHDCWGKAPDERPADGCAMGDRTSRTTVALLGDSHADHWLGGLDRAGKEHGWRVVPWVNGGCPVSDFSGLAGRGSDARYGRCHRYREAAVRAIIASRPRAVVLSSFDSYIETADGPLMEYRVRERAWTEGLRRTYARFARAGIPVIVLRGTPRVPFDVPSCLSRRAAGLAFAGDCAFVPDAPHLARARRAQERAALGLPVRFVDMNDLVCGTGGTRCATERGGVVLFTDDNHLTASFTRSLGGVLGARVAAAMGQVPAGLTRGR